MKGKRERRKNGGFFQALKGTKEREEEEGEVEERGIMQNTKRECRKRGKGMKGKEKWFHVKQLRGKKKREKGKKNGKKDESGST